MNKLIEIAKVNGAYPFDKNGNFAPVDVLVITPDQLHATVEQVCAPLVEALGGMMQAHDGVYVMPGESHKNIAYRKCEQAIGSYRALIGDKHE